jgi:2-dehydro-3-deoxy-D-arabinonate dehydratase
MKLHRFRRDGKYCLSLELNHRFFDLSAAAPVLRDVTDWLAQPDPVQSVTDALLKIDDHQLEGEIDWVAPIDRQEVWASGVTYERSRVARIEESEGGGDFYDLVYDADRPELFFKSTAERVVGPGDPVRIRRDSKWNVPEPELVLAVAAGGKIVGYTIGNDMSSRSIEGENPLYLPQAKVYDGSCALGPGILIDDLDPQDRSVRMSIERDKAMVYTGETSTGKIRRPLQELADYLTRELTFPHGVFLFTGTGIVPPNDFSLRSGDVISIEIEGIGILRNPVA